MVHGNGVCPARRTVSGEVRLPNPVDDAILTLGVRVRDLAFI